MNPDPFPYKDFQRAGRKIHGVLQHGSDCYLLLTADSGAGKTTLSRRLEARLDRCQNRLLYLSCDHKLGAAGFVRVLARSLRLSPFRSHAETTQDIARQLAEDPQRTIVLFDNAQELPDETLLEARTLAESRLQKRPLLQVLFVGLPPLRSRLQAIPQLWRRLYIREELTGLVREELPAFVEHHFDRAHCQRLNEDVQSLIFERGRGIPGFMLPMLRLAFETFPNGTVDVADLDDRLQQWDLG